MSRTLHINLALLAVVLHSQALQARTYTVQKGDTLSDIASRELGRPIWGAQGSLQKLLEKNPDIQNPDRIYPDQIIRISDDDPVAAEPVPEPEPPLQETAPADDQAAAPAPAEDPASSMEQEDSAHFGFKLGLGLAKEELEANDRQRSFKSIVDSELQTLVDLDAYYKPTADSRVGVSLGLKNAAYDDTSDGRFEGRSRQLYKLSVFGDLTLADRWHLGLELGSEQNFFVVQKSLNRLVLEEAFVDFGRLTMSYDLVVSDNWRWNLGFDGSYLAAADTKSYRVENGSSYGVATGLQYRWNAAYSAEGNLHYGRRTQGVEDIRQKVTDRSADLALRYEF